MPTTLVEIFRDSETHHRLSLFDLADLKELETRLFEKNGKPYLKCLATDKDRPAKPEEIVRQLWIKKLLTQYGYPKSRIAVEHPVKFGSETKRAASLLAVYRSSRFASNRFRSAANSATNARCSASGGMGFSIFTQLVAPKFNEGVSRQGAKPQRFFLVAPKHSEGGNR